MARKYERLLKACCMAFFGLFILFLTIHSLFFTSEINSYENIRYLRDNIWLHLLVVGLLLGLALLWKRRGWHLSQKTENRLVWLLMAFTAAFSVAYVLMAKSLPIFDQALCISAAEHLAAGNFDASVNAYYLDHFPYQLPLVLFLSLLSLLGGGENVIVYQLVNVAANLVSFWALAECSALLFQNRKMRIFTWLATIAFLPITFYTPFVYGNLYGLAFMLLGVRWLFLYLQSHQVRHLWGMLLAFIIASLLKQNYRIAAIAAAFILVADALQGKKIVAALAALLILAGSIFGNNGVLAITRAATGADLSQGFPMSIYVMLGLQEEDGREPGWHNTNGYRIYEEAGYNTEVTNGIAWQRIRERLQVFAGDPGYGASFFYRKNVSQWDEPSFQSLWVNEMARNPERGPLALSLFEHGKAGRAALWWMNQYQSIVLIGICLWIFWGAKKQPIGAYFFPLLFVGGFLFHFVWEAKAQYTLFYFFCLIPYALQGYRALLRWLDDRLQKRFPKCSSSS